MPGISRGRWERASRTGVMLLALGGGVACSPPAASSNPVGAAPAPTGAIPLRRALVLAMSGPPPHDTSVTFRAGAPRTIVLTHPVPEHLLFAELVFPSGAFAVDSGREITVQIRPRPGVYGLDLEASAPIGRGASVTFKYPRYFSAPPEARRIYGSDVAFERALAVGRLEPDSVLAFLPSTRPASDNLQAPLPSSGTYLVAAPP